MPIIKQRDLDTASEMLRSIAHPLRLSILKFVDEKGVINVNKIYNSLLLEQSITSQHLRIMRTTDMVETKREGKFIYYNLNYDKILKVNQSVTKFFHKPAKTKVKELIVR